MQKLYQVYVQEQHHLAANQMESIEKFPSAVAEVLYKFLVQDTSWTHQKFIDKAQVLFICKDPRGIAPLDSVQKFNYIVNAPDGSYHTVAGFATSINNMYGVVIKTDMSNKEHCILTNVSDDTTCNPAVNLGVSDINVMVEESGVVTTAKSAFRAIGEAEANMLNLALYTPPAEETMSVFDALAQTISKIPRLKIDEQVIPEIVKQLHEGPVHLIPKNSEKTSAFDEEPVELPETVKDFEYDGTREVYIHTCSHDRSSEDDFCKLARLWNFSRFGSNASLMYEVDSFVDKKGCTHYAIRSDMR